MEKIILNVLLIITISLFVLSIWLHIHLKNRIKRLMTKKPDPHQRKAKGRWNAQQKKLHQTLAKRFVFVLSFGLISLVLGLMLSVYSANGFKASFENQSPAETGKVILDLDTPEQSSEVARVPEEASTPEKPHPFNQQAKVAANFLDLTTMTFFPAELEVTVLSSIRGEEAWRLLVGENQFNPAAPAGKEYLLNRLKFKIVAPENPTAIAKFSEFDFSYLSSTGNPYDRVTLLAPDRLQTELEVNSEKEGIIYSLIDIGDIPVINYQDSLFLATQ